MLHQQQSRPDFLRRHSSRHATDFPLHHSSRPSSPSIRSPTPAPSTTIKTHINYFSLPPPPTKPIWNLYLADPSDPFQTNVFPEKTDIEVRDIRGLRKGDYGVDKTGWDLVGLESGMEEGEWWVDEVIKQKYYSEVENLLKTQFSAHRVIITSHLVRRSYYREGYNPTLSLAIPPARSKNLDARAYQAHVDYSSSKAEKVAVEEYGIDLEKERVMLLQVWQPLGGEALDAPLAVADWNSVDEERDFSSMEVRYLPSLEKEPSEAFVVNKNPNHTWWSPSRQTPSELLLFKAYDSKPGMPGAIPHTAFQNPQYFGKEGVRKRENVEIRALVVMDKDW